MTVVLTSVLGFIVAPSVLIGSYLYYREYCRRTCHACWIGAQQLERRGTKRGAISSVLLPHSCPTGPSSRLRLLLRPAATRNLIPSADYLPQLVERHAQVKGKRVSAFERKPARLLRIAREDARDVRDRTVRSNGKVS